MTCTPADIEVLRQLPLFETGALLQAATVRDHAKGSHLFLQGDAATRLFVVISGCVKLYRVTEDGEEAVVGLFTRGDMFGEAAGLENAVYPSSAQVAEDARIAEIPARALRGMQAQLMGAMAQELHRLRMENEHKALMDAAERVGCLLLELTSDGKTAFPYDKALAAQKLGMTPETFSRALAKLKPLGVTVDGPGIRIENPARLAHYACAHCSASGAECAGARLKARSP